MKRRAISADVLVYSGLTTARYALEASTTTDEAKATEPLLWSLALRAEYGSAADAYAALMAAKKALEDALRDGASEEEIARLVEAFKDAAQRYIAAKMAEALANGLEAPPSNEDSAEGPSGSGLGGQGFSDMLDALEDLTETGATDQARQLLADITNMLENLRIPAGPGRRVKAFLVCRVSRARTRMTKTCRKKSAKCLRRCANSRICCANSAS